MSRRQPRPRRLAVLARVRDPRPRRARALARAALPRPGRGRPGRGGLGSAVRLRSAGSRTRRRRPRRGGSALPRTWPQQAGERSPTRTTASTWPRRSQTSSARSPRCCWSWRGVAAPSAPAPRGRPARCRRGAPAGRARRRRRSRLGGCRTGAVRRSARARVGRAAPSLGDPGLPAARPLAARLRGRYRRGHGGGRPAGRGAGRSRPPPGGCSARTGGRAGAHVPVTREGGHDLPGDRRAGSRRGVLRRRQGAQPRIHAAPLRERAALPRLPRRRAEAGIPAAPGARPLRPRPALLHPRPPRRAVACAAGLPPAELGARNEPSHRDRCAPAGRAAAPRRRLPRLGGDLHARPAHRPRRRLERRCALPGRVDRQARRARGGAPAPRRRGATSPTCAPSPDGRRTSPPTGSCASSATARNGSASSASSARSRAWARRAAATRAPTGSGRAWTSSRRSRPAVSRPHAISAARSTPSPRRRPGTGPPPAAPGSTRRRPATRSASCSSQGAPASTRASSPARSRRDADRAEERLDHGRPRHGGDRLRPARPADRRRARLPARGSRPRPRPPSGGRSCAPPSSRAASRTARRRRTARRPRAAAPPLPITSCATRWTSSAVTALMPGEHFLGVDGAALEHLAAQPEHDRSLRALELEHEAALGEVARLLELVRRHRLVGDASSARRRSS